MHAKTDSEATSIDAALSPPRSAIRPLYYVQSPSNHDVEKMSFGSGCSLMGSPSHPHYYHCSPIHHSRESSTSRFSDRALLSYKSIRERRRYINDGDDKTDGGDDDPFRNVRLYACLLLSLVLLFSVFSLILWGASKSYPPKVVVKVTPFTRRLELSRLVLLKRNNLDKANYEYNIICFHTSLMKNKSIY